MARLLELILVLAPLSLVAVGGGNSIAPELHRQSVLVHNWMSESDFANAFVLAQSVPGPNILVVSLVGWAVAGLPGALVATLAMLGPSSVLALLLAHGLRSVRVAPWRYRMQRALSPLTIGLSLATGVVLARSADHGVVAILLTVVTVAILMTTRIHPLLLMGIGAMLGLLGLV